jgi:hypothetical protein
MGGVAISLDEVCRGCSGSVSKADVTPSVATYV